MLKCINDSLKTEHYHLAFKIKMAEGTNDFLKRLFLLMELLDVALVAVSERLDSEDGQDHTEFVWIFFSVHLYICWTAVFDCCLLTCLLCKLL